MSERDGWSECESVDIMSVMMFMLQNGIFIRCCVADKITQQQQQQQNINGINLIFGISDGRSFINFLWDSEMG